MREAHTVEQVRAAEATRMAELPDGALLQQAAAGLAYAVRDYLGGGYGRRVVLLVGPGNNGGDALYAGALLARRGVQVEAWLLAEQVHDEGLAALRGAGGRVADPGPTRADVALDGIVGIGARPGLREGAQRALAALGDVPIIAVDVPSGVGVDEGTAAEPHVHAALTVTFGTLKPAHLVGPAALACGSIHLVPLGLDLPEPAVTALRPADVGRLVPQPAVDAQKYSRGVVGVRAGSTTYPGAALLCVSGAASGIAGMVRYDGPVADVVRQQHPEVVGPGRVQAWVVGSGGGDTAARSLRLSRADGVPVVVDADALAHARPEDPDTQVLTPHAGELAAMTGADRADIEADPLAHARAAAEQYDSVVLLKGPHTLVAHPDGRVRATVNGTPWLATAGAGDVLAGLIGSLAAGGLELFDAASVGSWLHASAARLALADGPLTAGKVAATLPEAIALALRAMEQSPT
jgi:hydroxyethylthiazole kinase-like uncharacterized protein yjeF